MLRVLMILAAMPAIAVGLVAPAFAQEPLPTPTGLVIDRNVPQVPDSFRYSARLSWQPVSLDAPFEYVVEVSVPPRAGGDAPYGVLARIPGSSAPQLIIFTSPWLGPTCFRVRTDLEGTIGEASAPLCVAKVSDVAPFDITDLHVELGANGRSALLSWDYGAQSTRRLTIQRSLSGSLFGSRNWETIATEAEARNDGPPPNYVDSPLTEPGWYCYRAKLAGDLPDLIWSNEACVARPVIDGPLAPDLGNSFEGVHRNFLWHWEFAIAGALWILSVAIWLPSRRHR